MNDNLGNITKEVVNSVFGVALLSFTQVSLSEVTKIIPTIMVQDGDNFINKNNIL